MDMTTLQQSLVNAKKVMNKVDDGNFKKGNTSNSMPMNMTDSSGLLSELPSNITPNIPNLPKVDINSAKKDLTPKARMTESQIKNSKLPEAIKQARIDNPIPDVPFNGGGVGLSEEFLSGVKNEMSKQGMGFNSTQQPQRQKRQQKTTNTTKKLSSKNLKSIIKESVREILDEVVDTKINESIGLRSDMNENFQFRVGDKVFYGKITSTKTVK